MTDKVEVVDIKEESDAEGKLETLNEEDTPDFNEISETVALEEQKGEVEQANPQDGGVGDPTETSYAGFVPTQEEVEAKTTAEAKK